ncbi:MipA/OmpV family protein [Sulfurimonas sp.]|uniref:MipA/OmpV family protein n=1 Tax=Sulfurimonas sp. TaxID=2022749 RepID=UPI002B4833D6|nr:MipA/OmpV family protein [Sulfurimonas sp.]
MKYLLLIVLILSTLLAEEKKQKLTLGLGPYIQTQPYKNVDDIIIPSPVIFFDNGIVYIRWSRAGIYFLGDKTDDFSWGLSVTFQPRVDGYTSSDIAGMDDRKKTLEGGIAFSLKMDKAYMETMLLTDVLDRYEDLIFKTEIGYDFEFEKFSIYPSAIIVYQSSSFIDYYYGVKKEETTRTNFAQYTPNGGLQLGMQTYIKYPFTKKISALINLRIDKIANEATSSPIVEEDYIYSGLFSLIYTFEY